jgi:hypothetical protein
MKAAYATCAAAALAVPALLFACSDSNDSQPAPSAPQDASAPGDAGALPPDPSSSPDAPRVLTLTMSPLVLRPAAPVTIGAIVSDPQGLADVAGGTLGEVDKNVLGVFDAPAGSGSGAFTFALTWEKVNAEGVLEFGPEGLKRTYRATFFDAAGHTTSRDFQVTIECDSYGLEARNGVCDERCVDTGDCQDWATRRNVTGGNVTCRDRLCMAGVMAASPTACGAACGDRELACIKASSTALPDAGPVSGYATYGIGACYGPIGSCDEVVPNSRDCGGSQPFASQTCYCR